MPRAPRMKCAFAQRGVPKSASARAAPATRTPEEREEKKALEKARDEAREKEKEWKITLQSWVPPVGSRHGVQFPILTKSDAKRAFGLTENEITSLPYMGFYRSGKTIYRLTDCKSLADRKRAALGDDLFDYPAREVMERPPPTGDGAVLAKFVPRYRNEPEHTLTVHGTTLTSLGGREEYGRRF
ncbi:hypothetical protein DAEQUDRAFT_756128 [Daedalea quercina L-15889]|uniref:Uncharacterized protein n=1 Tax=Daedalea quercina L-15889 TaxID=1314783 RepID=A0A165RHF6_9APHY|nr:hypothetical protein DAEQUDRAFT_756128 [Daedalea quercina L-15889]